VYDLWHQFNIMNPLKEFQFQIHEECFRSMANKMGCGKGGFTPSRRSNVDCKRPDDLFVLLVLLWCLLIFLHWCLGEEGQCNCNRS